jgi:ABC-type amino acid transport substrate-binding protein
MRRSLATLLFCLAFPFCAVPAWCARDVRITVGIYQNEPIVFRDGDGKARGIYIDILEHIAKKEGWVIEYSYGTWSECLDRLERGQIDLLTGIAYSEERTKRFSFTRETLVTNWAQVYVQPSSPIKSMIDLGGRKMAVVRGDIYYETLRTIKGLLNIHPEFAEFDSYREVLEALDEEEAEAALVPRIYGAYHESEFNIERSTIMFSPTELRFALPKGSKPELADALDRHVATLKKDKRSIYYTSLNVWIEGVRKLVFPKWLRPTWVIGSVGGLLVFILAMNFILRWRIRVKTLELKATLAAKEKIESELRIAHDIQMGSIPKEYPSVPGYNMYGFLRPARQVGGDFYDFFLLEKDRLCFVLGDVSDKGVPAALFMAVTNTLIKANASAASSPGQILDTVNRKTFINNDACMFVTVFCGVLDMVSGRIRYTNAGHNPPLVIREHGGADFLEAGRCPALGIDDEVAYEESVLALRPGDTLFMYTDGVTEALNEREDLFSDERLQKVLSARPKPPTEDLVHEVLETVDHFAGRSPQADDIAMLAITRLREEKS